MARARNIKPGFFRNADLVELSFEARLLFIGLWTIADRDGRMEDRPKQIKMELFPADSVDVDAMLNQLVAINMIERYSHEGQRVIQVVNFTKHQNPHRDEKASTLPDRDGNFAAIKEAPKKHGANTVQAQCKPDADTVAIGLIPESLLLNPDSLIPDSGILNPSTEKQPVAVPAPCFFEEFWGSWPKHPRKVAKDQCRNKWRSKGCDGIKAQVMASLAAHKASEAWKKGDGEFIPAPLTWLNQSRWEAPTQEQAEEELSPWYEGGRKAIEAKAVELGLGRWDEVREQWGQYRHRVFVASGHLPARSTA